jgi:hypothetical protein
MTVGKVNKLMSAVHVRHELSNRIVGGGLTMSFIALYNLEAHPQTQLLNFHLQI